MKEQTQTNRKILKGMKQENRKNQTTLTNCKISFDIHTYRVQHNKQIN